MTVYLLDVNVLIALVDPNHVQHDAAHDWFGRVGRRAFATCPISENGLVRILSHPKYPSSPGAPGVVMNSLNALRAMPGHRFWPDNVSLADGHVVDPARLSSHAQLTDTYLLALAKATGGKLASMDRRLVTNAVLEGGQVLALI